MAEDKIKCNACGKMHKFEDYYSSSSYFMRHTGKVHTCKKCIWEYVEPEATNKYDLSKVKNALRMIDKPFILDLWESSKDEAEAKVNTWSYFKVYMKNIALPQNINLSWADSDYKKSKEVVIKELETEENIINVDNSYSQEDVKVLKKVWGNNFVESDFEFLENFYGEYKNNFPTDTPAQVNIYRNLAKIHLQAEKELEKGNIKSYKDLMDLSSKMHNDGNIKPIQSTGMNDDKGVSTYGMWIKTIEFDEPCEYFEDKKTYEDYDYFRNYIEKWFVRPFKNIFNLSKDFDVKDDK